MRQLEEAAKSTTAAQAATAEATAPAQTEQADGGEQAEEPVAVADGQDAAAGLLSPESSSV